MSNVITHPRQAARPGLGSGVVAVVSASVIGALLCQVVAWVTLAAGASDNFIPLHLPVFTALLVAGTIAGVVGWSVIRRRAADPRRTLAWLVPTMLLISWIPDVLVGVSGSLPGTSWVGVVGLAVMHVCITVSVIAACQWMLPVQRRPQGVTS